MAGYTAIYCVGGEGGFQGADGINPIWFQIWQGDGNRQWLEVHYIADDIKPLGSIRTIVPRVPYDADMLLDACLAFFPQHFESCGALAEVRDALRGADCLDFASGADAIPPAWNRLRLEAVPLLAELFIVKGDLRPIHPGTTSSAAISPDNAARASQATDMRNAPSTHQTLFTRDKDGATEEAERHPAPAPHVESLHAPDDIGGDANLELFGDHDRDEDVGPVG